MSELEALVKSTEKIIVIYSDLPLMVFNKLKTILSRKSFIQYDFINGMHHKDTGYGASTTALAIQTYVKKNEDKKLLLCDLGTEPEEDIISSLEYFYSLNTRKTPQVILVCKPGLGVRLKHIAKTFNYIQTNELIDDILAKYKITTFSESFVGYLKTVSLKQLTEAFIYTNKTEQEVYTYIQNNKGDHIIEKLNCNGKIFGLDNLESWLMARKPLVTGEHPVPLKGFSVLGIPGCGKTMSAQLAATTLGLPLYKFNIHTCLGKYVGQSEANAVKALAHISSLGKCVVLLDEVDKVFGKDDDNQTSSRVMSILLSYMDNNKDIFWVLTGNNIDDIPPELLRKGRLDEYFYIGLPMIESVYDYIKYRTDVFKDYGMTIPDDEYLKKEAAIMVNKKLLFNDIVSVCDEQYLSYLAGKGWDSNIISTCVSSFYRYEREYNNILDWSKKHAKSAI